MQGTWPTSRKLCIIPKSLTSPSSRTYVTFSHSHKMPNLAFIYPTKTSLKLAFFTAKLLQTLSDPLSTSSQPRNSTLFNYCKPRSHDPPLFVLLFSGILGTVPTPLSRSCTHRIEIPISYKVSNFNSVALMVVYHRSQFSPFHIKPGSNFNALSEILIHW